MDDSKHMRRREAIVAFGGLTLSAWLAACGGDNDDPPSAGSTSTGSTSGCVLTPEQTEGPYWVPNELTRRDVTEGRPGVSLELRLTVQDADACEQIVDADVEIWHCDAAGEYSGVNGDNGTFLRGHQKSDADGAVRFDTIYPGWYTGRTTHIHVKVHLGGDEVHTGQLYFDDAVTTAVGRTEEYAARGEPDTTNASDGIYADGGERSSLSLRRRGDGYVGSLTLGVRG